MYHTVIVANVAEAFIDFLSLNRDTVERTRSLRDELDLEERCLFWKGDEKIVITSHPVVQDFLEYVKSSLGYAEICNLYPSQASGYLSRDILTDECLLRKLLEVLSMGQTVDLFSYTATPSLIGLAEYLTAHNRNVRLPESPSSADLWTRDYLDTKIGFRAFVDSMSTYLSNVRLPEGYICEDAGTLVEIAAWFLERGRGCICKPNRGESGIGMEVLLPESPEWCALSDRKTKLRYLSSRFERNDYLRSASVIEEYIRPNPDTGPNSPSLEYYIPPKDEEVRLTNVQQQTFEDRISFFGVWSDKHIYANQMVSLLIHDTAVLCERIQHLGYVGMIDFDFVIGQDGLPYIVEANPRRTGGTHVHEAAQFIFGEQYWEKAAMMSFGWIPYPGRPRSLSQILHHLSSFIYPIEGKNRGAILSCSAAISRGYLSYSVFGKDLEDTLHIQSRLMDELSMLV